VLQSPRLPVIGSKSTSTSPLKRLAAPRLTSTRTPGRSFSGELAQRIRPRLARRVYSVGDHFELLLDEWHGHFHASERERLAQAYAVDQTIATARNRGELVNESSSRTAPSNYVARGCPVRRVSGRSAA
jgi:hypothetical protein